MAEEGRKRSVVVLPDIALSHMYVDNAAMQLVRNPKQFDVIIQTICLEIFFQTKPA